MGTKYETGSSIWIVDEDSKMVTRIPKSEADANHGQLPYDYVGKPEVYETFERDTRFMGMDQLHFTFTDKPGVSSGIIFKVNDVEVL